MSGLGLGQLAAHGFAKLTGAHVDGAGVGAGDHDDDGAAVCWYV